MLKKDTKNIVWSKFAEFLKQLRCEDTDRDSYIHLLEYEMVLHEKGKAKKLYETSMALISEAERQNIQSYFEKAEICFEEECQQAYMQGMIDCLMILSGMNLIPENISVKDFLKQMR
ncbi:MAG: hypothetical protein U0N90_09505 [Blautia sp.]|jgi:hypothetical protein